MSDEEIGVEFAVTAEKWLDWPRRGAVKRLVNAVVAIGYAALAVHVELKRANDARDALYREVVDALAYLRQDDPQRPEDTR